MGAIAISSAAFLALLHRTDEAAPINASAAPIRAKDVPDSDAGSVSVLSVTESQPLSPVIPTIKSVSMKKSVIEKEPVKPGKLTIEELPAGLIKPGTKIRLRAGAKEGGQEFILEFNDAGQIIIDGKPYEQAAKAYRELPVFGKKLLRTVPLKWSTVTKIVAEDGTSRLDIVGQPIDGSAAAESAIQTEDDLVTMAANAEEGKLKKPLGKKIDKTTGFEVDVEWTIAPAKK